MSKQWLFMCNEPPLIHPVTLFIHSSLGVNSTIKPFVHSCPIATTGYCSHSDLNLLDTDKAPPLLSPRSGARNLLS